MAKHCRDMATCGEPIISKSVGSSTDELLWSDCDIISLLTPAGGPILQQLFVIREKTAQQRRSTKEPLLI